MGIDPGVVPFPIDPAPVLIKQAVCCSYRLRFKSSGTHCSTAIHRPFAFLTDKEKRHGDDEGTAIANDAVHPPPPSEGIGTRSEVEDEKDIDCHRQRPPRVRLHEPASRQQLAL